MKNLYVKMYTNGEKKKRQFILFVYGKIYLHRVTNIKANVIK